MKDIHFTFIFIRKKNYEREVNGTLNRIMLHLKNCHFVKKYFIQFTLQTEY